MAMTEQREMPHDFLAEISLLGALLYDNKAWQGVAEFLLPHHFADPLHAEIYTACGKLIERGQTASAFSMKAYFDGNEAIKEAGGNSFIARMVAQSVNAFDVASVARLIKDAWTRRQIIDLGQRAVEAAYGGDVDAGPVQQIEALERGLYDLALGGDEGGFRPFSEGLAAAVRSAEKAHHRSGGLTGLATGLGAVDRLLGGLHKSDLVILAGRPGMGKSALACNMAMAVARNYRAGVDAEGKPVTEDGGKVGIFSLEMSSEQVVTRLLAETAGVASERVRRGQLNAAEMDRLIEASQDIEAMPLFIDETPALTITALRTRARRLKRQHGLDLIVVDYLQLVDASSRKDGRVQEVSEITRGLKTLAKELDVPVLALSQLSRAVEGRVDKRPQLADLRDSGTIEQDADVVMFVYREEYYLERGKDDAALAEAKGKAEVHIAKQRHGPTGVAHLLFDGPTTKFRDVPEAGPV